MDLIFDDIGTGPAVFLIHAGIGDRRMWKHQVAPLAERYRVVVFDERGYGDSPWAAERSPHLDLLALMDHLGIERAAAVGCSNGGRTAADAVLTAPGRFTALGLIAAGMSGFEMRPSWLKLWQDRVFSTVDADRHAAFRAGTGTLTDEELQRIAVAQTRMLVAGPDRDEADLDPRVWELAVDMALRDRRTPNSEEQVLDPPASGRLGEIEVPTLVIAGGADVPEILDMSEAYATGIAGARRVDIPATGHLPPLERPAEVNAALLAFLGDVVG